MSENIQGIKSTADAKKENRLKPDVVGMKKKKKKIVKDIIEKYYSK